jgi:hypothetical protein
LELERVVYGTREGQRVESVLLEAHWRLPAGKCSYWLQDGDQALAVDGPYQPINGVLQRMWGLEQSVASLEPMTRTRGEAIEGFGVEQAPAPAARAEQAPWQPLVQSFLKAPIVLRRVPSEVGFSPQARVPFTDRP